MSRMWARTGTLAAAALGLTLSACGHATPVAGGSHAVSTPKTAAASTSALSVDAKGFAGHGRLAFVSGGRLYILDGTGAGKPATLHAVPTGSAPGDLTWSPDGKWLAFLVGAPNADGSVTAGQLWLSGPDGQDAHSVLASSGPFAWSPKADVLAAISSSSLDTIAPGQAPRPVLTTAGLTGTPAWSPDGATIAISVVHTSPNTGFTGSAIELVTPHKGVTVLARSANDALLTDAWWTDGQGVFAWSDLQYSASLAADGAPLVSYPLHGRPVTLPSTLIDASFAVPDGDGVVVVTGGDRYLWHAKTFEYCSAAGACSPAIDATPAPVNLDPAWFPLLEDGEPEMAFVHAAPETATDFGQAVLNAWYGTRQLWIWHGTGANPYQVAGAGTGVAAPTWSSDGKLILYAGNNALWLIDPFGGRVETTPGHPALSGGQAVRVVSRLFAGAWPDYYGDTDWQSQFAWYTGQPTAS
jgi:Tol biopolymer transport system component